jgi:uncharacterized membrane protein
VQLLQAQNEKQVQEIQKLTNNTNAAQEELVGYIIIYLIYINNFYKLYSFFVWASDFSKCCIRKMKNQRQRLIS